MSMTRMPSPRPPGSVHANRASIPAGAGSRYPCRLTNDGVSAGGNVAPARIVFNTGGVVGGTLGLLAGIGALAIPGVGPLIAAGPIMATLAGAGAGGAVGGLVGALVGMGIPEYEAKRYEGAVKGGGTLLSVHCDTSEQIDAAKTALKNTGARDISSSSEAGSKDTSGGRGTFGNITDGERLSSRPPERVLEQDDVVTADRTTTRY